MATLIRLTSGSLGSNLGLLSLGRERRRNGGWNEFSVRAQLHRAHWKVSEIHFQTRLQRFLITAFLDYIYSVPRNIKRKESRRQSNVYI